MQTLVVFSHTNFSQSIFNKLLLDSIKNIKNVTIKNLDAEGVNYSPEYLSKEVKFLKQFEKIIFQFPLFWFSVPHILKQYIDIILTPMLSQENILAGKEFQIITTCGGSREKYEAINNNEKELDRVLYPLNKSMEYIKMKVLQAYGIYDCHLGYELTDKWQQEIQNYKKLFL